METDDDKERYENVEKFSPPSFNWEGGLFLYLFFRAALVDYEFLRISANS